MNSHHPFPPDDEREDHVDESEDNRGNRVDYTPPSKPAWLQQGEGGGRRRRGKQVFRPQRGVRDGNGNGNGYAAGGGSGEQRQRGPRPQGNFQSRPPRQRDENRPPRGPRPHPAPRVESVPPVQAGEGGRPQNAIRPDETKIYGVNACLAVFAKRPDAIIRAYVSHDVLHRFGYAMKFLAEQRRAYHIVASDELERITESQHHGGVCFLVRKRAPLMLPEFMQLMEGRPKTCAVLLEGVSNPHNLGAIVRSCAHFGVDAVLTENTDGLQSGAAARTAEGGTETVTLVQYGGLPRALETLKAAGFKVVVTSSHAEHDLYATEFPERCVILVGAEGHGVSKQSFDAADLALKIPGSGEIESLNVGVATGIVLAEHFRRSRAGT